MTEEEKTLQGLKVPTTNVPTLEQQQIALMDKQKQDLINVNNTTNAMQTEMANIQKQDVQANTDFAITEINRKKAEADKELLKEGAAAQTDYQKLINPYGVEAEQRAANNMNRGGYSESSKVNAWTATQNRITSAKETTSKIKTEFDAKIAEARLSSNSTLAKIALEDYTNKINSMWKEYEFTTAIENKKTDIVKYYDELRYQREQDAIALKQKEQEFAYAKEQDAMTLAQREKENAQAQSNWEKEYALSKKKLTSSGGGGGGTTKLREGTVDVKNGVPYHIVNGKWVQIEYPKDQFGNKIYTKQEKFNKMGYQYTIEKAPVTYTDKNGKIQNLDVWYKDNQAYIMPYDVPIVISAGKEATINALYNGVKSGKLPAAQATRVANQLGF